MIIVPTTMFAQDQVPLYLYQRTFGRIIVDEAHQMRNPATNTFRNVSRLDSHYKWAVTGTPIQNGYDDLFTLTDWLGIRFGDDIIDVTDVKE